MEIDRRFLLHIDIYKNPKIFITQLFMYMYVLSY